ncbi:MAG: YIP1 family protein [Actinomycetota bacterium]|nr:YIP1 family protein [Actinomycetota bacterium]
MASTILTVYIIPLMQEDHAPEFDLNRPFGSAVAVIRTVLFSPRRFYLNFKVEGPLKEPAVFVLLVGAVSGILGAAVALSSNLLFGDLDAGDVRAAVVDAVLFALLSPVGVGVAAGVYLLSIRTFVGKVSGFREVYRMSAYAAAALVLAWIPILGAFAFTYALMVLMGIGIQSIYRTSFLTAVVTAMVGFVPVASVLVWLTIAGEAS